jgi:pre-mRNA-processing factor 19
LTSIPALLSTFQNEWDSLALETFSLRQELQKTRQELSTALYHHDAAIRVVARLTRERDEARDALAKLAASIGSANTIAESSSSNVNGAQEGASLQTASAGLPENIVALLNAKQQELTPTRKKRKTPAGWATAEQLKNFTLQSTSKQLFTNVSKFALDPNTKKLILTGGGKSQAGVYSVESQALVASFGASAIVSAVAWTTENLLVVGTKAGHIEVFRFEGSEVTAHGDNNSIDLSEYGRVVDIQPHPVSSLVTVISTTAAPKLQESTSTLSVLDLSSNTVVASFQGVDATVSYTSLAVHPDGILVAVGTSNGTIEVRSLNSGGDIAATLDVGASNEGATVGAVTALSFSENGYWLASAVAELPASAQLWDLRKLTQIALIALPTAESVAGSVVHALAFDYSGQFLAATTASGVIDVVGYIKASKSWTPESLFAATDLAKPAAYSVAWGTGAVSLYAVSAKGAVQRYGLAEDVDMAE